MIVEQLFKKKELQCKTETLSKASCSLRQHYLVQVRWVLSQNIKLFPTFILIKHPKETPL